METVAPQGKQFPAVVIELAKQADGSPLAYRETETQVIIVFVDGRKLTFEKLSDSETITEPAQPARSDELPAPLTKSAPARKSKHHKEN